EARVTALRLALTLDFPCVLITGGFTPPRELVVEAERASLPLLKTTVATPAAIAKLSSLLEDSLAERTIVHSVLMDTIELVVQLERWHPAREYERLGLDDEFYEILGLRVPLLRMPVAPGRNIAILVEVAARNQLLRSRGHHAARRLADRLERTLRGETIPALDDEDEELR